MKCGMSVDQLVGQLSMSSMISGLTPCFWPHGEVALEKKLNTEQEQEQEFPQGD